ncbi:hypothetical protein AVEN_165315-1 [Araneus ventricosus]|uniref:Uncharacterized protein n=1 Tax=Araneus ventricosus TaxID=182803 RepID=A0A4Y2ASW8_ARAVE|nr:hypothetical protein AVEN_165315-1 [Araneus ventricosus]
MDERERTKVLSAHPITALNHCLKWPFQSLFVEMAMHLCNKMDIHHFEVVFRSILDNCIIKGLKDFDYKELLEEFWHLTPAAFKEELKNNVQLMKQITIVLNYDKTNESITLGQILNKYMRKNLPE